MRTGALLLMLIFSSPSVARIACGISCAEHQRRDDSPMQVASCHQEIQHAESIDVMTTTGDCHPDEGVLPVLPSGTMSLGCDLSLQTSAPRISADAIVRATPASAPPHFVRFDSPLRI
jgi:hypothetical protein